VADHAANPPDCLPSPRSLMIRHICYGRTVHGLRSSWQGPDWGAGRSGVLRAVPHRRARVANPDSGDTRSDTTAAATPAHLRPSTLPAFLCSLRSVSSSRQWTPRDEAIEVCIQHPGRAEGRRAPSSRPRGPGSDLPPTDRTQDRIAGQLQRAGPQARPATAHEQSPHFRGPSVRAVRKTGRRGVSKAGGGQALRLRWHRIVCRRCPDWRPGHDREHQDQAPRVPGSPIRTLPRGSRIPGTFRSRDVTNHETAWRGRTRGVDSRFTPRSHSADPCRCLPHPTASTSRPRRRRSALQSLA
jgi:hypothetical protein